MSTHYSHVYKMPAIEECENLTASDFLNRFGKPNIPFLLKNGVKETVAMNKWDWQFFSEKFGQQTVIVYRTSNRNDYQKMLLKDYIHYILTTQENDPLYLLDWFLDKNCPQLHADYSVPAYFHSWIDQFITRFRSKFLAFYIGPKNSASPLHIDILSTSAWNAVFRGQKLWVFYPPEQAQFVYRGKVNPFAPDYSKYPLFKNAQGLYSIQNAGDLMFTPSNWWHAVLNVENTLSLTDNFINQSNYKMFLTHLFQSLVHLSKRSWQRRKQQYNK